MGWGVVCMHACLQPNAVKAQHIFLPSPLWLYFPTYEMQQADAGNLCICRNTG